MRRAAKLIGGLLGAAAGAYAGYVATTYVRFGRAAREPGTNPPLDRLVPEYEVCERHRIAVAAPADVALAAARAVSFSDSPVVRCIFALRALPARLTGARPAPGPRRSTLDEVLALGWRVLADVPGRQLVFGAVTQPWRREVQFRGLPPEEFVAFREPGYAKIAWTLEVDPVGPASSVFRTETRVVTTDPGSRERFRRYWALLSPGILVIRYEMLRLVRAEAERRHALRGPARP